MFSSDLGLLLCSADFDVFHSLGTAHTQLLQDSKRSSQWDGLNVQQQQPQSSEAAVFQDTSHNQDRRWCYLAHLHRRTSPAVLHLSVQAEILQVFLQYHWHCFRSAGGDTNHGEPDLSHSRTAPSCLPGLLLPCNCSAQKCENLQDRETQQGTAADHARHQGERERNRSAFHSHGHWWVRIRKSFSVENTQNNEFV